MSKTSGIPRNIFQTWKTCTVPNDWLESQKSVIDNNPSWRYIFLTDEDNLTIIWL